jgi:cell division FtsZ-interacting protein ZapD
MTDKEITPKTVNDLKLINAGRILENNRTLVESRVRVEVPGGVITMHVVVHPPQSDKNSGIAANLICLFLHCFLFALGQSNQRIG